MTKSARGATTPAAFAARERAFLRKSSFHDIGVVAASNARAPRFLCSHRPYLLEKRGQTRANRRYSVVEGVGVGSSLSTDFFIAFSHNAMNWDYAVS